MGIVPVANITYDPVVQSISSALYYVTMNLLQEVFQPNYLQFVINQLNWPPVINKNGFIRSSLTYGVAQQQYNRCQYVQNVLGVIPSNCTDEQYNATTFAVLGYWSGQNLLSTEDDTYTMVTNSSSTSTASSSESISNSSIYFRHAMHIKGNIIAKLCPKLLVFFCRTIRVGIVVDEPFVISCEECPSGYQGYAIDIVGNLSITLKFTVNYTYFATYNEMLSQVSKGNLDLGVGAIL